MCEKEITKQENVEKTCKEKLEDRLEKVKNISEILELYKNVKEAVSNEEVDNNFLKYIENSLEDKFFSDANIKDILPKVLIEVICPDLVEIEKFDSNKLQIENIGMHFEEQQNYIDKICIYDGKLVNVFGIKENKPQEWLKYEARKFTRADMIEAVAAMYEEGQKIKLYQYDEYYIGIESERIKVFTERKVTSLVKIEETIFDKIKTKISSLFAKKKCYPNLNLAFDSNPNRLKDFEYKSKVDAKARMKALLNSEREITRSTIKEL